ncbi:MAG TPA: MTH1187 family thiamine-binding protein [candidate division Zixibacteria bacterium]|nr:MTH1187 family thiamine-binding protein [candidate division Zixibacteria bacterium]
MLVEFATFPVDKGPKFSKPVAKVVNLIDKSGLKYQTTAMCTLIEGDWDEIFALIKKCHYLLRGSSSRVYTRIVVDDRKNFPNPMTEKVDGVEEVLKRKIRR